MTKSKSRKPAARRSAPRPAAHPGLGAVVHDGGVAFRVVNRGTAVPGEAATESTGFGEWPMRLQSTRALPLLGGRPLSLDAFVGKRAERRSRDTRMRAHTSAHK